VSGSVDEYESGPPLEFGDNIGPTLSEDDVTVDFGLFQFGTTANIYHEDNGTIGVYFDEGGELPGIVAGPDGAPTYKLEKLLPPVTVSDANNPSDSVTPTGSTPVDLYVPEVLNSDGSSAGYATINLHELAAAASGASLPWSITGDSTSPDSGNLTQGTDDSITLTPSDDNYDFDLQFQSGSDSESAPVYDVHVHVYTVALEFNNTSDTNDDVVMLSTPADGPDIPASQPELDVAASVIGDGPPGMTVTLDNPDGRLGFGTETPSSQPTSQPSSPVATQPTTQPFTLPTDGSWVHLSVFGLSQSVAIGDAGVRVTASVAGQAGGIVVAKQGATVFWFDQAKMDVVADGAYSLQGGTYGPAGGNAVDLAAEATIEPAGLDTTIPRLANLRIGIVQNVDSESVADVYGNPQMVWNADYPNGDQIPPEQIDIPSMISRGDNLQLSGGTFPILDTIGTQSGSSPIYDPGSVAEPMGYANGGSALSSDGPFLLSPLVPAPEGVAALEFDGTGQLVGTATYNNYIKTTRAISFTDWCVLVDASTGATVLAALAQNEWQVNLDTSVGNQVATAGQSHLPSTVPVLSGPPANSIARALSYPTAYGAATTQFLNS
jgi:hypothetical protein